MPPFDALPRLGWTPDATEVERAPGLAVHLGVADALWVRDDHLPVLHGGTKVRKLDLLLASEPFASAPAWVTAGAYGSGHVVAVVAAGRLLGRPVHVHLFRTPGSVHGAENLAYTLANATSVRRWSSRVALFCGAPRVILGGTTRQGVVIPPGGTTPRAVLGVVRAAYDVGTRIRAGELPEPDAVYLPLGTAGTAVGVALGLAAAGVPAPVRAVAVVETALSPRFVVDRLVRDTTAELTRLGLPVARPNLELVRGYLGRGYGWATPAANTEAAALQALGVAGEPCYTGKTVAAMRADAAAGRTRLPLYWVTVRAPALGPAAAPEPPPSRRGVLLGVAAAVALVGVVRTTGYPSFDGGTLTAAEAATVRAAGEALFPDADATTLDTLAPLVDAYLRTFPDSLRLEVHALFAAVEQLLGGLRRFTRLSPADRLVHLEAVAAVGGPGLLIARSLRDLVLIAWYQRPEAWAELGYEGPMVSATPRDDAYATLRAPAGWSP